MFQEIKKKVQSKFEQFSKDYPNLFYVEIDRDKIWDLYLNGFKDGVERQSNNCNCCKSFLRQYAGIVAIDVDNNVISLWDFDAEDNEEYANSIKAIREYIHTLPITDVFYSEIKKIGTDKNLDNTRNIFWNHFYLELDPKYVHKSSASIDTIRGEKRDNKSVLRRSLDEITDDSCKTVLELIAQNSLYRGIEFKSLVEEFYGVKKEYNKISADGKDVFCWANSINQHSSTCKIKNTVIGTLLSDISEGMDLDRAVTAYEKKVAPSNYKRPAPVITTKMVEDAKKTIQKLGYEDSLERRYATPTDININNLIYIDKSSNIKDVFNEMSAEVIVNPKTFTKIEEVSITDFIDKIVPTAKSIEVLFENSHLNNMVSLLTSSNDDSPSMFKWNNNFSWSYTGGITDSIKERVKEAGGNVDGELRVSLSWFNYDDLDIHVIEPNGHRIYYGDKRSNTSGHLDVDMNAGGGSTRIPVENIVWTNKKTMLEGTYKVEVNNFSLRETTNVGFIVQIECNGETFDFEEKASPRNKDTKTIISFNFSKKDGITINGNTKSNIVSKEKWRIKTNQFYKVKQFMLSPNHWDKSIGNKHFLLFLDGCVSDESPRGFFNEFLKDELISNKNTFEVLGSKIKVEPTDNQLSGIGFSETQRNSIIVKVRGTFERNIKVNF
jgi:hypothetical protein